ncbi:hypothetical protein ACTHSN_06765 [Neisseria sp. P0009.S010]|uniref:hypothetical protein n=1 Tax=unclassified Neisseria TaxID=2623750 RepID=UPI003F7EFB94
MPNPVINAAPLSVALDTSPCTISKPAPIRTVRPVLATWLVPIRILSKAVFQG